jgi:hypothetical protein
MNTGKRLLYFFCIAFLLLPRCNLQPINLAGGASGTDLSACVVSGTVVDSLGMPFSSASVYLRRAEFLASDSGIVRLSANGKLIACDTETDRSGTFRFESVDTGSFSIEVNYNDSLGTLFVCTIASHDVRFTLPPDTICPLAVITGHINANEPGQPGHPQASLVQVYGMQRRVKPDSSGFFRLELPCGQHTILLSSDTGYTDPMEISVFLHPDQERDLGTFRLDKYPPHQPPCRNIECDLAAVREMLDSCGLSGVPVDSVVTIDSGRVTGLHLQNRNMTRLPWGLERLEKLKTLDLSGNAIVTMPRFGGFFPIGLRTLILRSNQLAQLPPSIVMLRNIETLDLSNNKLQSLPDSIVSIAPRVLLDLGGNKLCSLPPAIAAWADMYDVDWRQTQNCQYRPAW